MTNKERNDLDSLYIKITEAQSWMSGVDDAKELIHLFDEEDSRLINEMLEASDKAFDLMEEVLEKIDKLRKE